MIDQRIFCRLFFISFLITAAAAQASEWQVGTAKAEITPEQPLWMAGYGARTAPAEGTLSPLWAKALVLDDGQGHRGVVITLDLVGIDRELSQAICDQLQRQHDLRRDQIVLSTSHTHCGPVVGRNLGPLHYLRLPESQQEMIDAYAEQLQKTIGTISRAALENMTPCQLSWGIGDTTFAVNRRENTPYSEAPRRRTERTLQGPVDHDVPVLAARTADGTLKAILFGYACHATTLSRNLWSGDYPGYAQAELERLYPECTAYFWAGCGADQNPLPRRSVALAEHYGRRLATAVEAVLLTSEMRSIEGELTTQYNEIDLPLAPLPSAAEIRRDAASDNEYTAARARLLLQQLEQGPLSTTYPYPISCWSIGDAVNWIGLGGEVVVDYALRLKNEFGEDSTWVAGYCHDVMAYIPSRRVLREGGYEGGTSMVYYGLPTVWAPSIENQIVAEVRRQVETSEPVAATN